MVAGILGALGGISSFSLGGASQAQGIMPPLQQQAAFDSGSADYLIFDQSRISVTKKTFYQSLKEEITEWLMIRL